jgi:Domain of unknown function (DUF5606)
MDLKEIASVSGKPGLFKVLKPTRLGVVLESLDEEKIKLVVNSNTKVSILKEISIYTTTPDKNIPLSEIFIKINAFTNGDLTLTNKSDESEIKKFVAEIIPDYDTERVYLSDMKKLLSWYHIVSKYAPELLVAQTEEVKIESKEEDNLEETSELTSDTKEKKASAPAKKAATKIKQPAAPKSNATPKVTTAQRPKK